MNEKDFSMVDLSAKGLRKIPADVLANADSVVSLILSGKSFRHHSVPSSLGKFKNLTSLKISDCDRDQLPENLLSRSKLERLILRDIRGLTELWPSYGNLQALKELVINNTDLKKLPDSFGKLATLEKLKLPLARNLTELCSSFGELQALKEFGITVSSLTNLPDSFGKLSNLENLAFVSLFEMKELCSSFGHLKALKKLVIASCGLRKLPDSFGKLTNLETLEITACTELTELCSSFGDLQALKNFEIFRCPLASLPYSFGKLFKLEKLRLVWCDKLKELCSSFGDLQALKELHITDCALASLPSSFGMLPMLEVLQIEDCVELTALCSSFGDLQALRELSINKTVLASLPNNFGKLPKLEKLEITQSGALIELCSSFGDLQALKELDISSCALPSLPNSFGKLPKLEKLRLACCHKLKELCSSFGDLQALTELHITDCALASLPSSFGMLPMLEKLTLTDVQALPEFCSSLSGFQALKELEITNCGLKKLPDSFRNLAKLCHLGLQDNRFTEYPTCTLSLENLRSLDLSNGMRDRFEGKLGNCIEKIPLEFEKTQLQKLSLRGNPIKFPPEGIWNQDVASIKSFMKDYDKFGEYELRPDAINMLGESNAGKTSIALSLVNGSPRTAKKDDRTRALQKHKLKLDSMSSVYINDFGGHAIYQAVVPIFLPFNGLSIITYKLSKNQQKQQRNVEKWLLTSIAKSSEIRIVVAGTHSDKWSSKDCQRFKKQMESFVRDILKTLRVNIKKACEKLCSSENERYQELTALLRKVNAAEIECTTVSCKASGNDFRQFYDLVVKRLRQHQKMPRNWILVMEDLLKERNSEFPYHTMPVVKKFYETHVDDDPSFAKLPTILRYLVDSSQVLWLDQNEHLKDYVFYSPTAIVEICKTVLHHDKSSMELPHLYDHDVKLYKEGKLTMKLLKKLFKNDDEKKCEVFCDFLKHFNLMTDAKFVAKACQVNERMFAIAGNLRQKKPSELRKALETLSGCSSRMSVNLSFIGSVIPLSFFETSLLMSFREIDAVLRTDCVFKPWRDGLLIIHDGMYLVMRRESDEKITLTARSTNQKKSPMHILSTVLNPLKKNLRDSWPGIRPVWSLLCPECQSNDKGKATLDFEEFAADRTEPQSSKCSSITFNGCGHSVERNFCYPISQDPTEYDVASAVAVFTKRPQELLGAKTGGNRTLQPTERLQQSYDMSCRPHGLCLIINIVTATSAGRKCARCDVGLLRKTFKELHYKVRCTKPLDHHKIEPLMKDICKEYEQKKYDSFVCFILAYGNSSEFFSYDGAPVNTKNLLRCFHPTSCSSLKGKPKFFFILTYDEDGSSNDGHSTQLRTEIEEDKIPDFLVSYWVASNDYESHRKNKGSSIINQLRDVFKKNYQRQDLCTMLTNLDSVLENYQLQGYTQVPMPCYFLQGKVFFCQQQLSIGETEESSKTKR